MPTVSFEDASSLFLIITVYVGVVLAASWFSMIIWAYRDMGARSRDSLASVVVAVMVALLNIPGLIIYVFLRPRETLSEAYERSLEEEALLQEIEENPLCPTCRQHVHNDWQACPHCHTRLKKSCIHCGKGLDLAWNLCPHCATIQSNYPVEAPTPQQHQRANASSAEQWVAAPHEALNPPGQSLEFVDGEDY